MRNLRPCVLGLMIPAVGSDFQAGELQNRCPRTIMICLIQLPISDLAVPRLACERLDV